MTLSHQTCHAWGCEVEIFMPRMLMCRRHWLMVTPEIRSRVNNAYTPGQTRNKRPTLEWRIAAWQAVNHVAIHERSENGIAVSESVLRMLFRRPEAVKLWYGEGSATADV